MYKVFDSVGQFLRSFPTYKQAMTFKIANGRMDWNIQQTKRQITDRQKRAVYFVETWLKVKFNGNINNFYDVSNFLNDYLNKAKSIAEDAYTSYYSQYDY